MTASLLPSIGARTQPSVLVAALVAPGGGAALDPRAAELVARRGVSFYGEPMELVVAAPLLKEAKPESPAAVLDRLAAVVSSSLHDKMVTSCTWLWALHGVDEGARMHMSTYSPFVEQGVDINSTPLWKEWLEYLCITTPPEGSVVTKTVREVYGNRSAYSFAWNRVYVQNLWFLAAITLIALLLRQIVYEVLCDLWTFWFLCGTCWGLLLWTFCVLCSTCSHSKFISLHSNPNEMLQGFVARARNNLHKPEVACVQNALQVLGVILILALFLCLVGSVTLGYVQFMAWITYDWAECLQYACDDPKVRRGKGGDAAGLLSGTGFALTLQLMKGLAKTFAYYAAKLHNSEFAGDRKAIARSYAMALQMDSIGALMLFGLLFVAQWSETSAKVDTPDADCSDAWGYQTLGGSALFCLVRRIGVERRRQIFRNMLNGVLCQGPIIDAFLKRWAPLAARKMNFRWAPLGSAGRHEMNFRERLLGLIFAFDADSVGGIKFVFAGCPFVLAEPELPEVLPRAPSTCCLAMDWCNTQAPLAPAVPETSGTAVATTSLQVEEEVLNAALAEVVLKEYEPEEEVQEAQLSLLPLVMFAPIVPGCVFATLCSRIVQCKLDLTKLLLVRRRPLADDGDSIAVMHNGTKKFLVALLLLQVVWALLLSQVMYTEV